MAAPDFIVPPPGLIPGGASPAAPQSTPPSAPPPERTVRAPGRALPTFTPTPDAPFGRPSVPSQPAQAPTRVPEPGAFRLSGGDGFEVLLTVPVVLGRDPVPSPMHVGARAIAVRDPERSVSKTHALVDAGTGVVVVTDLHSTNGVGVQLPGGPVVELVPGEPTEAPVGSTLILGRFELVLDRVPLHSV